MKRDATARRGQELRRIDLDDWIPPPVRKPFRSVEGHTVAEWTDRDLRIGETLGLRAKDLDLEHGQLHVRQTVAKVSTGDGHDRLILQTPKTRSSQRTVHLFRHTLPEIRAWQSSQPKRRPDDLIFGDEYGRPVNDHQLRRAHKKAATAIGRPELHHDLRATAATMSAEADATVREIQEQLGHTTPHMTLRYQSTTALRDAERARRVSAWNL